MSPRVALRSLSVALPGRRVANGEAPLDRVHDLPPGWSRFWGIESRPLLDRERGEHIEGLALRAARDALAAAEVGPEEIDLVLVNLTSPVIREPGGRRIFPRLAEVIRTGVGATGAEAHDVEMECISFLLHLQLAANFIRLGHHRRILICSCECLSEVLDFGSRESTTFGDGAAAAVVCASDDDDDGDLLSASYLGDSTHYELATVRWRHPRHPGRDGEPGPYAPYFSLDARAADGLMMSFIPNGVAGRVRRALADVGAGPDEVDHFIFHQPGRVLLDAWAAAVGGERSMAGRTTTTLREHGCLVSVSIPFTLHRALVDGAIRPGMRVVLAGTTTGWGFAAQVWRWGRTRIRHPEKAD